MKLSRSAERALALSLSLAAAGAFCVLGLSPSFAAAGSPTRNQVANAVPVGGPQLGTRGVVVNLSRGVPPPPLMPGASFVLADMDSGQVLVSKGAHARHLPASTLKTLTALTLIPRLSPNTRITVTPQDVSALGTHLGVLPGTSYSVATLMEGMLVVSGNDAAYALARGNHGVAVTLAEMNVTAAGLGAFDTVAKDPSGLDKVGQSSSAYDLALIARAGMRLPDFQRFVMTKQATLPGGRTVAGKQTPSFKVSNHNKLLHNYPGAIGVKNGYTVAAKFAYVEAATRGGKTYLLTEMASPSSSWRPAAAMLDWAFAYGATVAPIGELVEPGSVTRSLSGTSQPTASAQTTVPPTPVPSTVAAAGPTAAPAVSSLPSSRQPRSAWIGAAGGISALALVVAWVRRRTAARNRR